MITNLSSPAGTSINDGISDEFARVSYASLDTALNLIMRVGPNAFMAKSDIESAFRLLPIASDDQHLLCFKFDNQFYVDRCLPMGARSSCALFEAFSSSLEYILHQQGYCSSCHYLDDFFFCWFILQRLRQTIVSIQISVRISQCSISEGQNAWAFPTA